MAYRMPGTMRTLMLLGIGRFPLPVEGGTGAADGCVGCIGTLTSCETLVGHATPETIVCIIS